MSRKFAVLVLILAAASAGVLYYTARIRPGGLVLTGIVTTDDVAVSSQIAGRLSRLLVKEGDSVTRDQLLAVIEPEELKADQAYFAHSEEGYSAQVQEAEAALRFQELQTRDLIRQAEAAVAATEAQQANQWPTSNARGSTTNAPTDSSNRISSPRRSPIRPGPCIRRPRRASNRCANRWKPSAQLWRSRTPMRSKSPRAGVRCWQIVISSLLRPHRKRKRVCG